MIYSFLKFKPITYKLNTIKPYRKNENDYLNSVFIIPFMLNGWVCYQKHHAEAPQTLCKPFSESNPSIDTQNHYESLWRFWGVFNSYFPPFVFSKKTSPNSQKYTLAQRNYACLSDPIYQQRRHHPETRNCLYDKPHFRQKVCNSTK